MPSKPLVTADYRNAPSGVGPLADEWKDKPHRLVYDLCVEIDELRVPVASSGEGLREATDTTREEWKCKRCGAKNDSFVDGQKCWDCDTPRPAAAPVEAVEPLRCVTC